MEEWKEYKLGDYMDVKGGKRLPKGVNLITTPNSHPYIRVRDLGNVKTLELNSYYEYVDNDTQKIISRYIVNEGDIIISIVGTIGLIGIIGKSLENANLTENCVKLVNIKNFDKNFLYYYLTSFNGKQEIEKGIVGAVQAKLPIKNIQNISIKAPSFPTQQKIANILSSLDDKIEVNRRINEQLEELAGALFKSWFVDFEPFKDGEFVESELGMIPKGWKVGTLDEVSKLIAGGDKPEIVSPNKTEETQYPIYSNGIDNYGLYGYTNNYRIAEESVTVSARGTIGYVCLREEPYTPIVRLISIIPNLKYVSAKFIYHSLKTKSIMGTGTTQQQLTVPMFRRTSIIVPPQNIVDSFTVKVNSMFDFRRKNQQEITHLTTLRDTLLPKLMSGEIDVN